MSDKHDTHNRESLHGLACYHNLLISIFCGVLLVQYLAHFFTLPFANVENRPLITLILCLYSISTVSTCIQFPDLH